MSRTGKPLGSKSKTKPFSSSDAPIELRFAPALTRHGGELLSNGDKGTPVHAATFIRKRSIVLDTGLLATPVELARILNHELAHFRWTRLANSKRREYEALLNAEISARARGELGWSAELRKQALQKTDIERRTRRWREYVCESFCDSVAWYMLKGKRHEEFTLAARHAEARRRWLTGIID